MFRRILIIFGLVVICALFGGYFYHISKYTAGYEAETRCNDIQVVFKGNTTQRFISDNDLKDVVKSSVIGRPVKDIDTGSLEKLVSETGVISHAEVYVSQPATLVMEVEQRNPIVRISTEAVNCYADSCGYLLPLMDDIILDLPIISGHVPVVAQRDVRGFPVSGRDWLRHTLTLTETVRHNSYWSSEIEQIWVNSDSDFVLFTRSLPESFIFGQIGDRDDIQDKLDKMAGYYRTIRPRAEGNDTHYNTVNLKYKNQIICK